MIRLVLRATCLALSVLALANTAFAGDKPGWTAVWATAQVVPDAKNALPPTDLTDATLRQVVRVSAGGKHIRVRLSNAFGTSPLRFDAIEVARSAANDSARTLPDTRKTVTFAGQTSVTIPAGADYVSDVIDLPVSALDDVAISTYQPLPPAQQTGHPGARAISYLVHGSRTGDTDLPDAQTFTRWYTIAGIEVENGPEAAVAILGDSITDGYGVQPNTNARWPDTLMKRLNAARKPLAVLNLGIGGNRLLLDGSGPNAMARLERDVLSQPGLRYIIVLEGVNDLGMLTRDAPATPEAHAALVTGMTTAYRQIIDRARSRGIKVYGATLLPYAGNDYYHPDAQNEADRQAVNAWIRTPGHFDAVIDFDTLMRDPARPDRLKAEYDSGDHLHPSIAGYEAMGTFIDLKLFK